ncbi:MAG: FG-GAP-like repeat-containing protein [Syntrophothermus sp.]
MQRYNYVYIIRGLALGLAAAAFAAGNHTLVRMPDKEPLHKHASWHIESSPVKMPLRKIVMFPSGRGYIAGKQLLEYNGVKWSIAVNQPPQNIDFLFAENENSLMVTRLTPAFGSEVYLLSDGKWKRKNSILSNQISSVEILGGGKAWVAGDREIAFYDGNTPHFITYPPSLQGIREIKAPNIKHVYANTFDNRLFYYDGSKWHEELKGENIRSLAFRDNTGLALAGSKIFIKREGKWSLHSEDELLKKTHKAVFSGSGTPWAIGAEGIVLCWKENKWEINKLPVKKYLHDIQMISDSEGWITGDNGLILHYTEQKCTPQQQEQIFGFDVRPVIGIGKNIDDEYGIAVDDLDGDGLKDIFAVCLYEPARLYMNKSQINASGENIVSFNEEAATRGLSGLTGNPTAKSIEIFLGAGLADVDEDGDEDLLLCNLTHDNKLFLNDGKGYFRNVSEQSGRAGGYNNRTNAAVFADVDNDGDLDIYTTCEYGSNRLYLNNGAGYFKDITQEAGLTTAGGGMGAVFGDVNGDGLADIYLTNWAQANKLYLNVSSQKQGVRFSDITEWSGTGGDPFTKSNGAVLADIDNNGTLDLFVTNRGLSNRLYINNGQGRFKDITAAAIEIDTMLSYGAAIDDFNNDGWQDIYVANVGRNVLYKNVNGTKFIKAHCETDCLDNGYYTGVATGDVDNDGDVDIYSASYILSSSTLLLNSINNRNYLSLNIAGTVSSRDAAGVKAWVYEAGFLHDKKHLCGFREVRGGGGYVSHSSKELSFGLKYGRRYDIAVWFPASGIWKIIKNIAAGQRLTIREEEGWRASISLLGKDMRRLYADTEAHSELAKYMMVILALSFSVYRGRHQKWQVPSQIIIHTGCAAAFILLNRIFSHDKFMLSDILPVGASGILLIIIHLAYERIVLVKLARAEKEATRNRIARDLHDDLASTISTAIIYTDMLGRTVPEAGSKDMFSKVSALLNEAAESITDVIWTVSPKSDRLQDLISRVNTLISETAKAQNISCRFQNFTDSEKFNPEISAEIKRNIYLIFKEALNNTVKYASASEIIFRAELCRGNLLLEFRDNGTGFSLNDEKQKNNPAAFRHGNFLDNMRHRASEINAQLSVKPEPGMGTSVDLFIKMT